MRIVAPVKGKVHAGIIQLITKMQVAWDECPRELFCVGIQKQLVGIEAMPLIGLIGTVDAIAVALSRSDVSEMNVPDVIRAFRQSETFALALSRFIEQAKLDLVGMRGEQREVCSPAVGGGSERKRRPRGHAHLRLPDQEGGSKRRNNETQGVPTFLCRTDHRTGIADVAASIDRG